MGEIKSVTVDIDKIMNTAHIAIRRASVFMAVGYNAVSTDPRPSHVLDAPFQMKFVPDELPDKTLEEIYFEFNTWILSNGMRDLLEYFAIFLAKMYGAALILKTKNLPDHQDTKRLMRLFEKKSASDRLFTFYELCEEQSPFQDIFESLKNARNCLSHRMGVVGITDVGAAGTMVLKWRALRFEAVEPCGRRTNLREAALPIEFRDGAQIQATQFNREKTFHLGEKLIFDHHEISDLCMTFVIAIDEIKAALLRSAEKWGARVRIGETPSESA